ncbi:MFS transporter [Ochrobactrum cytisi]|nr:MFS transporter [Brucella cytisi]
MSESQSGACSNGSPPILFLAGMFVSNVGRNAYFVCMTWIVLGSTNSVRSVTILLLTGTLAQFLSSGIIGFLADATDRRRLAIGLDLARAVIVVLTGFPVAVDAGVRVCICRLRFFPSQIVATCQPCNQSSLF